MRYNLPNLTELVYRGVLRFLVDHKNYDAELLTRPLDPSFLFKVRGS